MSGMAVNKKGPSAQLHVFVFGRWNCKQVGAKKLRAVRSGDEGRVVRSATSRYGFASRTNKRGAP